MTGQPLDRALLMLEQVVRGLRAECLTGPDASRLVKTFVRIEHLAGAGKALCAARVSETESYKRAGHRSAAEFLAAASGESRQHSQLIIDTATRVKELAGVEQALRSGKLSLAQADIVSAAAGADPSQEGRLLRQAGEVGLSELKDEARRVRQAVLSEASKRAAYAAIHKSRFCRTYTDDQGAFQLSARLTPDVGATVAACLQAERNKVFKAARMAKVNESYDAYSADAFVSIMTRRGQFASGEGAPATVYVRVDASALRRGHTDSGELCDIAGVGPVPVAVAKDLLGDSWLKLLVTDGVDIKTVCHFGRTIPAHIRSALEFRDPVCVVPGCNVAQGLQIDHHVDVSKNGPTRLENLRRLCAYHHRLKTVYNYDVIGGPGNWKWVEPPDSQRTRK